MNTVEEIKEKLKSGTYDWSSAIETCAEKIVLLSELDMF